MFANSSFNDFDMNRLVSLINEKEENSPFINPLSFFLKIKGDHFLQMDVVHGSSIPSLNTFENTS